MSPWRPLLAAAEGSIARFSAGDLDRLAGNRFARRNLTTGVLAPDDLALHGSPCQRLRLLPRRRNRSSSDAAGRLVLAGWMSALELARI